MSKHLGRQQAEPLRSGFAAVATAEHILVDHTLDELALSGVLAASRLAIRGFTDELLQAPPVTVYTLRARQSGEVLAGLPARLLSNPDFVLVRHPGVLDAKLRRCSAPGSVSV